VAVRARRSAAGQHFLRSSKLAAELVQAGIRPGDLVLDLGAGAGVLTAALVRADARVTAVEIDTELAARLRGRFDDVVEGDVLVEWGFAAKRSAVWPSTQLSAYWGAWFELFVTRRLPRCVFAPPPSVDAGVLGVVRRGGPLVAVRDARPYWAFLARGYKDGPRAVSSWTKLRQLEAELGFDRHAAPRDLDAGQWAGLFAHAVRRSV